MSKISNRFILSALIITSTLLTSCATKFTAAQRAGLSTVAIARTAVENNAYTEPSGADIQLRQSLSQSGASGQAGAAGGLIGALIGEGVAATQNAMFKGKNKIYFPAVQRNTPGNIADLMTKSLQGAMKDDRFFGPRVKSSSSNVVTSKVSSYGLVRTGKDKNGDLLLAAQVTAEIRLLDSSGKRMFGGVYPGVGGYSYTTSQYANDPAKSKQTYDSAVSYAVFAFMNGLETKTAD